VSFDDAFYKFTKGNRGVIAVVLALIENYPEALEQLENQEVFGIDIWILYKDICHEDPSKMLEFLENGSAKTELSKNPTSRLYKNS
jgi:hypothetical protein